MNFSDVFIHQDYDFASIDINWSEEANISPKCLSLSSLR